jgi:hypothetical protein
MLTEEVKDSLAQAQSAQAKRDRHYEAVAVLREKIRASRAEAPPPPMKAEPAPPPEEAEPAPEPAPAAPPETIILGEPEPAPAPKPEAKAPKESEPEKPQG